MNVLASRIAPFLHHIESLGHKHQVLTLFNAAHVKHKSVGQSVTAPPEASGVIPMVVVASPEASGAILTTIAVLSDVSGAISMPVGVIWEGNR